jgi:hypothetical protein
MAFDSVPMKAVQTIVEDTVEATQEEVNVKVNVKVKVKVKPKHEPEVLFQHQEKVLSILSKIETFTIPYGTPPISFDFTPPKRRRTLTEVLIEARKLIEEKGWGRGALYEPTAEGKRNFCIMGAIYEANGGDESRGESAATFLMNSVISDLYIYDRGDPYYHRRNTDRVAHYNDKVAKSQFEIMSMFDKAIHYSKAYNL